MRPPLLSLLLALGCSGWLPGRTHVISAGKFKSGGSTRMQAEGGKDVRKPFDLPRFARTAAFFGAFSPPSPQKVVQRLAENAGIVEGKRQQLYPGDVIVGAGSVVEKLRW